ncbi:hypothetical protein [Flavobacterium panacagri]|uniref:hypothetical protein n=1 Tax=Flavobacterium panacagri TaxID=3034146 RepID=UPI0025A4F069|nr:hypothetical protein [Flavobacterium panacagri]
MGFNQDNCESVNNATVDIIEIWEKDFKEKVKRKFKITKAKFTIDDALLKGAEIISRRDESFLKARHYLTENNPENNALIKYMTAFIEYDTKLNEKYYPYDIDELNLLYEKNTKFDEKGARKKVYNRFNILSYKNYVIFMVLKLDGQYDADLDDEIFRVTTSDNREYNPLTKIPKQLRAFLPFRIKEYDIKSAFPTFIDIELECNHRHNIYEVIGKKEFAMAFNANSAVGDEKWYRKNVNILKKVYGSNATSVLTMERYQNKGKAFRDFAKLERQCIHEFIELNNIESCVRLHDGIFVVEGTKCNILNIGKVQFVEKKCLPPIKREGVPNLFYHFNDKGQTIITPTSIADYFIQENFQRISTKADRIIIFKNTNNVVEPFNVNTDLLSTLKLGIIECGQQRDKVMSEISIKYDLMIKPALRLIDPKELKLYRDSRSKFGLPFKNGFYLMDKSAQIEVKDYSEIDGFFPKHKIQEHEFKYTDEVGMFERVVQNVSDNDTLAFHSMLGYLAQSYKDSSCCPAIILSDKNADNVNRNGGRGKTLFLKALQHVLPVMIKGGLEFDPKYTHVFADLESEIQLYVVDDTIAGFKFEQIYTQITGSLVCQRKGVKAETIPFDLSPKFVFTTNYLVGHNKENNSTNRRFIEYQFNNHYNQTNTPKKEFECTLFEDWDKNEWNRFYSFIYRCVAVYYKHSIISPVYNKEDDNYNILFNDAVKQEVFDVVMKEVMRKNNEFTVSVFLTEYGKLDHIHTSPKYFTNKNTKLYIDSWFNKQLSINDSMKCWTYRKDKRKWFLKDNMSLNSLLEKFVQHSE